jgi:hypothetical protein
MTGPTESANAEERFERIERMVAQLAGVENTAKQLATAVREKATALAAEAHRVARSLEIAAELADLEARAHQIAADIASRSAQIAEELAELRRLALRRS